MEPPDFEATAIRNASPADAAAITAFQLAMALETEELALDPERCAHGVAAVFADPGRGRYLVAERAGTVIASLLVTAEWSDWRDGWVWWLQSLYVVPTARGQGVYRQLWEGLCAEARDRPDVHGIRLYVDRRNARAQEVYRRLGMDGDHYALFEWMAPDGAG